MKCFREMKAKDKAIVTIFRVLVTRTVVLLPANLMQPARAAGPTVSSARELMRGFSPLAPSPTVGSPRAAGQRTNVRRHTEGAGD